MERGEASLHAFTSEAKGQKRKQGDDNVEGETQLKRAKVDKDGGRRGF